MCQSKSIIAGILLYNPDLRRLQQNVDAVKNCVENVLLVDNASRNFLEIQEFASRNKITLCHNNVNEGLPKSFNTMIRFAKDEGFGNLLLLDQDSICDANLVDLYKKNISSKYVCLTPRIVHRLKDYEEQYGLKDKLDEEEIVNESINSGTLINLTILPQDLRFNEHLFVDCVDFDFFLQVKKRGLKALRVNSAKLYCDLGNLSTHYFIGRKCFANNYSSFRLEKQAKDRVLFILANFKEPIARKVLKLSLLGYLMIVLFEKQKISKLFAVSKGFAKGIFTLFR